MNSLMELIPGLPNSVALECLIRIPFDQISVGSAVCKGWKAEIQLPEFRRSRKQAGLARSVTVVAQAWIYPTKTAHLAMLPGPPFYRLAICEPETGYWSELPAVPGFPDGIPMFCHLVGVGSELVVIGGCDPFSWQVSNSVFIYNFLSDTWRCGTDMPGGRRLFSGSDSDSVQMVYVAGGHDEDKNALKSALAYDVVKDEWIQLPDMAKAREECKGVFHRGKFHVIGGYPTERQGSFQRDAQAFDVATWQWDPVQDDFLEAATCPTTCVEGGDSRLYACHNINVTVRDGAAWQVLAGLPAELCKVAFVTAWQGKLLVIGSGKYGGPHAAYVMDLKNYTWTKLDVPDEYTGHVQSGCYLEI
ncbi:hypothetical protein RHGRI_035264 [Rhododendron griersonianum]|uniref:Kelch repeat-containing F-box family protein n=1 Tax=Rhododendron griersonianum TaxID=479676 RepID=A0AAV6I4Q6_9ERIC|nr:hypothetical protein RHGRI_035264 [Rhododendron griersonianum]